MNRLNDHNRRLLGSFQDFTRKGGGMPLRTYQLAPARAILESIRLGLGLDFVVIMPRQAGKDEMLAHLKAYLMRVMWRKDRCMVEVNPTYKPQTINAIMRLENRLDANLLTRGQWKKRSDFFRMIGTCRTAFYSGDGQANVVGATADLCLIINEAQDILPSVYAKSFAPMASSRAATRIFCGTVWTSSTLLAQMLRACREAEKMDGLRRVFLYTAEDVRKENPKYGRYVDAEVRRLGRNHPFIKTQYFCEEIDAQAGMFPPGRQALMHGSHAARTDPEPGKIYSFLIDVAGQDETPLSLPIAESAMGRAGVGVGRAIPPPSRSSRSIRARYRPSASQLTRWSSAACGPGRSTSRSLGRCARWQPRGIHAISSSTPPAWAKGSGRSWRMPSVRTWSSRSSSRLRSRVNWATACSASSKAGATRSMPPSTRPCGASSTTPSPRSCPARPN